MFHGDICWKDENDHFHLVTHVEILKILNENDGRKNQPKINNNIKRVILEGLENKKDNYEIEIINGHKEEYITKKFKQYEIAIEIISNLPTDEN